MELQNEEGQGTSGTATQVQAPPVDAVAAELAEVNAAIAAEEAAAAGQTPAPVEKPADSAQAAPAAEPARTADEHAKGNPTAAIIALRRANQELQARLLLSQGQNQALMAVATGKAGEVDPDQPAKPAEPETDSIEKVRAERLAIAEKFDAGEISAKDMEAERQRLEDREWQIRQQTFAPAPVVQATDLQLESATAQLEKDYPVLAALTVEHLEPLAALAKMQAAQEGKPIQPGAMGTLDLRTRIAKLANQHFGGGQPSTPSGSQPAALSADAQARADKLDLQQRMPPDVTNMGSPASDAAMSESEILARMEGMTEAEQWALLKTLPGSVKTALG